MSTVSHVAMGAGKVALPVAISLAIYFATGYARFARTEDMAQGNRQLIKENAVMFRALEVAVNNQGNDISNIKSDIANDRRYITDSLRRIEERVKEIGIDVKELQLKRP